MGLGFRGLGCRLRWVSGSGHGFESSGQKLQVAFHMLSSGFHVGLGAKAGKLICTFECAKSSLVC